MCEAHAMTTESVVTANGDGLNGYFHITVLRGKQTGAPKTYQVPGA